MDFTHTWAELGETVVVVSQSSVIYKIPSLQQGRAELSSRQYSTEQTRAEKERWEIRRSGVWNVIYIVWDISSCEVWIKSSWSEVYGRLTLWVTHQTLQHLNPREADFTVAENPFDRTSCSQRFPPGLIQPISDDQAINCKYICQPTLTDFRIYFCLEPVCARCNCCRSSPRLQRNSNWSWYHKAPIPSE